MNTSVTAQDRQIFTMEDEQQIVAIY